MKRLILALGATASVVGTIACGALPNRIDVRDYPPEQRANYAIFESRCSRCHGLERPINARVAEGGWEAYVRRMARHPGAGIDAEDQQRIATFLEYHHHRRQEARP